MKENRYIRVFLSSTFKDMQLERNYIMRNVLPIVRAKAEEHGITLVLVDLRWGIDVESEEILHDVSVIGACLDEIEFSRSYFIGIIGERYGWRPQIEEISGIKSLTDKHPWLDKYLQQRRSMTDIEFHYGVLDHKEKREASFYMKKVKACKRWSLLFNKKEKEDIACRKRLENEIRQCSFDITEYSSPEELGKLVEQDLKRLIDISIEGVKKTLILFEKEKEQQDSFLHSDLFFFEEYNLAKTIDAFLEREDADRSPYRSLLISGSKGIGKTSNVKQWIRLNIGRNNLHVVYHFVKEGVLFGQHVLIARRIYYEVSKIYHLQELYGDILDRSGEIMNLLYSQIEGKERLVIIIDGIDFLDEEGRAMLWMGNPPSNISVIYTSREAFEAMTVLYVNAVICHTIPMPLVENQKQYAKEYLLNHYGKNLSDHNLMRIARKDIYLDRSLLNILLGELSLYGYHEKLQKHVDYYLSADTPEDFYKKLLERYERDYGMYFVRSVLSLLAVSRCGLTENEMFTIMNTDSRLAWSQLYGSAKKLFMQHDGFFIIADEMFLETVKNAYADKFHVYRRKIVEYLIKYCFDEDRRVLDLSFQFYYLALKDDLYNLITDPEIFMFLFHEHQNDLILYWKYLLNMGCEDYDLKAYLNNGYNLDDPLQYYLDLSYFLGSIMNNKHLARKALENAREIGTNDTIESFEKAQLALFVSGHYQSAKDYDSAIESAKEALDLYYKTEKIPSAHIARAFMVLTECYFEKKDKEKVLLYARKAIEYSPNGRADKSIVASCHYYMGKCYQNSNLNQDAMDELVEAYKLFCEISPSSIKTIECLSSMGFITKNSQVYDQAYMFFDKGLRIAMQINAGEEWVKGLEIYKGIVAARLGNSEEAAILINDALTSDTIPSDVRLEAEAAITCKSA